MIKITTIIESNERFASQQHEGLVCVFIGATSGIGMGTLRKMATMLYSSTFYVLGRSESRFQKELDQLRERSPSCNFIFIETQVSLISGIDAACDKITSAEQKVDYLCMSPGGMPFQGAVYTNEGLELCFAVSYYSRLRLVSNLLPLLRQSPHSRVLSILNGTKEKRINEEDIGLWQHWGITAVVNHTTMFTSLAFHLLATNDTQKQITFIHATPGFVNTGTPRTTYPSKKDGILWWAFLSTMQVVSGWIIRYFGMALNESGERHAFHLTSDTFIPGSWGTSRFNDIVSDNSTLKEYKDRGWAETIWDYTLQIWDKALTTSSTS
ncbi:hypothetical protein BGZ60DRAFT_438356 [Tricladium varicosporioides]|nr:hypothetical protein BGZ60DRAFT_438356 [Hymenoscyphus varicosporioides]